MSCLIANPSDSDKLSALVDSHLDLMSAYQFMLRHTTFPQYPLFTAATSLPAGAKEWKSFVTRTIESSLALFGVGIGINLVNGILFLIRQIDPLVPTPARNQLDAVGLAFANYVLITAFALLMLNLLLPCIRIERTAESISKRDKADSVPKVLRPMIKQFSARLIKQHIYLQLQNLVRLYRARIAAMPSCQEERQTLIDIAEQTSKLKDSFAPKWQLVDILRFPSIIVGLLALLGFMPAQQLSLGVSVLILCTLLLPYVLSYRVSHLACERQLPANVLSNSGSVEEVGLPCSLHTLESRIYKQLECAGQPGPVRIDLVFQIFAGVLILVGTFVFFAQIGSFTVKSFLFWGCIEFLYLYFFIIKPWRLLNNKALPRDVNIGQTHSETPHTKKVFKLDVFSPRMVYLMSFLYVCFSVLPPLTSELHPFGRINEELAAWKSMVAFVDQHVGAPLQLTITEKFDRNKFTIYPEGSNRPCLLSSGDVATILNDERTVEVVSAPQSTCPPRYRAKLTTGVIMAASGFSFASRSTFPSPAAIYPAPQNSNKPESIAPRLSSKTTRASSSD